MRWKARKILSVGLGFGLVAIGAAALWIHERPDTSRAFPAPALHQVTDPVKRITPEDIEALKVEIERLKADKDQLARLSGEMKSDLTSLRNRITRAGLEGSTVPVRGEEADAANLTPEEELDRAAARTQAQIELIEGVVLAEKTDPKWASEAQPALNEAFQRETIPGMYLVNTECRTTLCRMELFLDGSTPEESFRNLVHFTPWSGESLIHIDLEGGSAAVYLAREGYSLPQLTE